MSGEGEAKQSVARQLDADYTWVDGPTELEIDLPRTTFAVLMKRDHYDFETGEPIDEEWDVKTGLIAERAQLMNHWGSQGWELVEEREPEDDPDGVVVWKWEMERTETIDGEEFPAWGTTYFIEGLDSPWADPPRPNDYWRGWDESESLAFDDYNWSKAGRAHWGSRPWRLPAFLHSSSSSFNGTFPGVSWAQYWLQAKTPVPDGGVAERRYVLLATSTKYDEDGEVESEESWTGTVRFAVGENEVVSDTLPEVVWNGAAPSGTWVEPKADGTLLAKPPVERGKVNRVRLMEVEVTWERVDSEYPNLEENINPFTHESEGIRVFPGKKYPTDQIRNKVVLKVKTSEPDTEIYVKAFDVDDPTPHDDDPGFEIDPNDHGGVSRGNDNRADAIGTPKTGRFTMSGAATANKTTDADGIAEFEFEVGLQPGNNYRVAVSLSNADGYAHVQVDDPSVDGYLGPREDQDSVAASPLLTVWRKLHIEMDSMQIWGGEKPILDRHVNAGVFWVEEEGTTTSELFVAVNLVAGEDFYEYGRIVSGNIELEILTNSLNSITVKHPNGHEPLTEGQKNAFLDVFEIYDDDDNGLTTPPLPRLDLINDWVRGKFRRAYIGVEEVSADLNPNSTIPFGSNRDILWPFTDLDDSQDMKGADRADYWYHMLVAAYQPASSEDRDPNTEDYLLGSHGATNAILSYNTNFSVVFVETIRDSVGGQSGFPDFTERLDNMISLITAHELGHPPGGNSAPSDHNEGGIMGDGAQGGTEFSPKTLNRFRSTLKWNP